MSKLNGYAAFDFKGPAVSGWVVGAEQVRVYLDGRMIGDASAGDEAAKAAKAFPGARTFEVVCSSSFTPLDVVSGRLVAVAEAPSGESFTLRVTESRRFELAEQAINEILHRLPVPSRGPIRQRALGWPQAAADHLARAMDRGEISPQLVPAGLRSPDGEVAVGYHGHLFYIGREGSLLQRYQSDGVDYGDEGVEGWLDAWGELTDRRSALAERYGAQYLHLVIPEKLTALRRWAPEPVAGATPALAAFAARFADAPWHLDVLRMFAEWQRPDDPFPTTDSHLSASGAQAVVSAIADRIAPKVAPLIDSIVLRELNHAQGDLARLMQLPFYSRTLRPDQTQMRRYTIGLKQVQVPAKSIGGAQAFHWTNRTAPAKRKVLIFGGPIAGEGDSPERLTWWLKHFFAEVRLDWRADIDLTLIDEWQPDVIITQTVERDLTAIPAR